MKYAIAPEKSQTSVLKKSFIILILFYLLTPELAIALVGGGGAFPF